MDLEKEIRNSITLNDKKKDLWISKVSLLTNEQKNFVHSVLCKEKEMFFNILKEKLKNDPELFYRLKVQMQDIYKISMKRLEVEKAKDEERDLDKLLDEL